MVRSLTLTLLILGLLEGLASMLILFTWYKISADRAIRPIKGFISGAFLYMGFWNFAKGNYLLSAVASVFFMIALLALMFKPLIETWQTCHSNA